MNFRNAACFVLLTAFAGSAAGAAETESEMIAKLIRQLGAEDFAAREAADMVLRKLGEPTTAPLRAALADKDPEVRRRVQALLEPWPPPRVQAHE